MKKVAILGFGAAGYNGACGIRMVDTEAQIDVYTCSDTGPHNPMLTTYYIKNAIPYEAMFPYGVLEDVEKRLDLHVIRYAEVVKLDTKTKTVFTSDGKQSAYDKVLIATGASAYMPDIVGADLPNVMVMRSEADAIQLKTLLESGCVRSGLVVGASWSGIKVAESFVQNGLHCTLMNRSRVSFGNSLYPIIAEKVQSHMEQCGIELAFGCSLDHIEQRRDGRLAAITQDGRCIMTDVIVMTSGIQPNAGFIEPGSIAMDRAIRVNNRMETSVPGIYAAGDCCEAFDILSRKNKNIALWLNSVEQGRTAGLNIAGRPTYFGGNMPVSLGHCLGMDFLTIGDPKVSDAHTEEYTYEKDGLVICAARQGKMLQCINLIGSVLYAGVLKNLFIRSIENPEAEMNAWTICTLRHYGLPESFINFLGGNSFD